MVEKKLLKVSSNGKLGYLNFPFNWELKIADKINFLILKVV